MTDESENLFIIWAANDLEQMSNAEEQARVTGTENCGLFGEKKCEVLSPHVWLQDVMILKW